MLPNHESYSFAMLHVGDGAAIEGGYMRAARKYV